MTVLDRTRLTGSVNKKAAVRCFFSRGKMKEKIIKFTKILPLFIFIGIAIYYFINRDKFTVEEILNFTPSIPILAIVVMWALFAIKSVSVFIPNPLLMMASGVMFSFPLALTVNVVGYGICLTIPYFVGVYSTSEQVAKLRKKYKLISRLDAVQKSNAFWMTVLTRQFLFLPCDVISLYLGTMKIKYPAYLFGSILGYLPNIILYSLLGESAGDPTSHGFIIAMGISLVLTVISLVIYAVVWKRISEKGNGKNPETEIDNSSDQ